MEAFYMWIPEALGFDHRIFYYSCFFWTLFVTLITWFRFPISLSIAFFGVYLGVYTIATILFVWWVVVYVIGLSAYYYHEHKRGY